MTLTIDKKSVAVLKAEMSRKEYSTNFSVKFSDGKTTHC